MSRVKLWILKNLAFSICWVLNKTYKYEEIDLHHKEQAVRMSGERGYVIALWHSNCLAALLSHAWKNITIMISASFDGELIAYVAQKLGLRTARGSSSHRRAPCYGRLD